jgi:tyrosyl-tRNA synthetase
MDILKDLKERGAIEHISDEVGLTKALQAGPVTFYIGFDPTGESFHVGHLVQILTMMRLKQAGHNPIAILGAGTAMVGDPSGKTETRQMISPEMIESNRVKLHAQMSKILGGNVQFINNADWLTKLNYIEFLRDVGKHFTINEMIKTETYKRRLEEQEALSFIEFNYQLLQAYDFTVLNDKYGCTLQLGGSDQWGNIAAGITLNRKMRGATVYGVTTPLVTTANGKKMGKTEKGAVWLDPEKTSAYELYQYMFNTDDRDVVSFLNLFTFLSMNEIAELSKLSGADIRKAKEVLAYEVTKIVHSEKDAEEAKNATSGAFGGASKSGGGDLSAIPAVEVSKSDLDGGIPAAELFFKSGLAESKTKATALIEQGGAYVNDVRIDDPKQLITSAALVDGSILLRQGKKSYRRVVVV